MADSIQEYIIQIPVNVQDRTGAGSNSAQRNLNSIGQAGNTMAQRLGQGITKFQMALSKADQGITNFGNKIKNTFNQAHSFVSKLLTPITKLKNMLFSLPGLLGMGAGMWAIFKAPIDMADRLEQARIGFESLLKSGEEADKLISKIQRFAIVTPFETEGLIKYAQSMLAMRWQVQDIIPDLQAIGDQIAGMGKGTEEVGEAVRVLGMLRATNTYSMQRSFPLLGMGINVPEMVSKFMGRQKENEQLGTEEINKMAHGNQLKGKSIYEIVQMGLKGEIEGVRNFKGLMMINATKTIKGIMPVITDTLSQGLVLPWGQGLKEGLLKGYQSAVKFLDANSDKIYKLGQKLKKYGAEISNGLFNFFSQKLGRISEIVELDSFNNASLVGKMKILWEQLIYYPMLAWWDESGKKKVTDALRNFGSSLGTGLTDLVKGFFSYTATPGDPIGSAGESMGGAFVNGFLKAIQEANLGQVVISGIGSSNKNMFSKLFGGGPEGSPKGLSSLGSVPSLSTIAIDLLAVKGGISVLKWVGSALGFFGKVGKGAGTLGGKIGGLFRKPEPVVEPNKIGFQVPGSTTTPTTSMGGQIGFQPPSMTGSMGITSTANTAPSPTVWSDLLSKSEMYLGKAADWLQKAGPFLLGAGAVITGIERWKSADPEDTWWQKLGFKKRNKQETLSFGLGIDYDSEYSRWLLKELTKGTTTKEMQVTFTTLGKPPITAPPTPGNPYGYGYLNGMAEGGIVTGPTRALIGEAGPEAVIPLSKMKGKEINVSYSPTINVTSNAKAEDVIRVIQENQKTMADEMAGYIAKQLRSAYSNMPVVA